MQDRVTGPEITSTWLVAKSNRHGSNAVVPEWYDGIQMRPADPDREVVGQRVLATCGEAGQAVRYLPGLVPNELRTDASPGFLFLGDDGDSLWFWPQRLDMAFRLEVTASSTVRRNLDFNVDWLLNQGALVYCLQVRRFDQPGPLFDFPQPGEASGEQAT